MGEQQQPVPRVRSQSVEKLEQIKEETFVEKMKDNFEGLAPSKLVRSFSSSKEAKRKNSDETVNKKSHSRTNSGSGSKEFLGPPSTGITSRGFMSSMYSSIRRSKSSGHHEDKLKKQDLGPK